LEGAAGDVSYSSIGMPLFLISFFFAFVPDYILVSLKHTIQRKVVEKGATEGIIAKLNIFNASLEESNSDSHEKNCSTS